MTTIALAGAMLVPRISFVGDKGRLALADDKSKKDYRDKTQINMNERYEVDYWKDRFGVSGQALAGAVRAVGVSVKKVGEYLKNKE
jgi:Protein of unknown function (DUF3606)